MIKFTATRGTGQTVIGLGLEAGNVERMRNGEPILVKLSDLGFTGAPGSLEIVIFYGKDIPTMQQMLRPMIGPDTVINTDPRLK